VPFNDFFGEGCLARASGADDEVLRAVEIDLHLALLGKEPSRKEVVVYYGQKKKD